MISGDYLTGVGMIGLGMVAPLKVFSKGFKAYKKITSKNGNSINSSKAQHGYVIYDRLTGTVAKVGVSGGKLNRNGSSRRANLQANMWNKETGNAGRYKPMVGNHISEGQGARRSILDWEKKTSNYYRDMGQLDPFRHIKP